MIELFLIITVFLAILSGHLMSRVLQIKKFVIPIEKTEFKGNRIVVFSDVHVSRIMTTAHLQKAVNKINSLHPDYVFFVGDVLQRKNPSYSPQKTKKITWLLGRINAEKGKFAVWGNHDKNSDGTVNKFAEIFIGENGYKVLTNEGVHLVPGVYLAGVDESRFGTSDIEKALENKKDGDYVILLAHEPDFADVSAENGVELQISGHSHGGQIYIPFTGSLFLTKGAKKYFRGTHKINDTDLLITYGVGTHTMPFRFLATPDILLLEWE